MAPLLRADLQALARALYADTGLRSPWHDPRDIAFAAGFNIFDCPEVSSGCGLALSGDVIAYGWHSDPRVRGVGVYRGLAEAVLWRRATMIAETDAWGLAIELMAPPALTGMSLEAAAALQRHAPVWVLGFAKLRRVSTASEKTFDTLLTV